MGNQASAFGVDLFAIRPYNREDGASGFHPQAAVSRKSGFPGGKERERRDVCLVGIRGGTLQ